MVPILSAMSAAEGWRVERVPIAHPAAQRLVAEVQQEYVVRYGGPDETPLDPVAFDPPEGAFFVGYLGEEPVATGAWRLRPDLGSDLPPNLGPEAGPAAEIKRMYVVAAHRRRGLAAAMLRHLESTAGAAGARRMVLETGSAQPEAIALYLACGYTRIEPFGHYAHSPMVRCYARDLDAAARVGG